MLHQGSIHDLRTRTLTRGDGRWIVVAMRRYPRGVARELMDEYVSALSPPAALLKEFTVHRTRLDGDHDRAFDATRFEQRFELSADAMRELERLAEMSRDEDVFLVCQCRDDQKCHRELLLLLAREQFGAEIAPLRFSYPAFARRLREGAQ